MSESHREVLKSRDPALAAVGQQYLDVMRDSHIGVVVIDMSQRFSWVNAAFARIVGWRPEQLIGQPSLLTQSPDNQEQSEEAIERLTSSGATFEWLKRPVLRRDGTSIEVTFEWRFLRDDGGGLVGFLAHVTSAASEPTAADHIYADLVAASDVGFVLLRRDGTVADANVALAGLVGRRPEDLVGEPFASYMHADDLGDALHALGDLVAARQTTVELPVRFVRLDGTYVATRVLLRTGIDDGRQWIAGMVVDVDGGGGAQHAEAIRVELERSNRELEDFAATASHDLKSPLQTITGFLELLQLTEGSALSEEGHDYIRRALAGGHRMSETIDSFLAFARTNQQNLQLRSASLDDLVVATLAGLEARIAAASASVTRGELPTVVCDTRGVGVVLQNLISNAIRYRDPERRPIIEVSAERGPNQWVIHVSDNGRGLPADADHLFEMYVQGESEGGHAGTGIGLATCRRIIEAHGGRIWAEPRNDGGSIFSFSLPDVDLID